MIRPLTCICMLLAGGSGLYLYQAKHRAQMLDREIARTLKAKDVAQDRIGVLRGEWALLNEPERLNQLSTAHLGLKTLVPTQYVVVADLGGRLPPPVAPGSMQLPADDPADPAMHADPIGLPEPPVPVRPGVAPKSPAALPSPAPVVQEARLAVLPRPAARVTEQREIAMPPRPAQLVSAVIGPSSPLAPPRPVMATASTPSRVATSAQSSTTPAGTSIGESVARAMRLRTGGGASEQVAASAPHSAPAQPSFIQSSFAPPSYAPPSYAPPAASRVAAIASTSALGGSRPSLPPPVPFGSAMATASRADYR